MDASAASPSNALSLALAQIRPAKGNYARNLERLGGWFARADGLTPRPQVLHLPETALSGYFVEGAVRDIAVTAGTLAQDLQTVYRQAVPSGVTLDVIVGFYERWQNTLYNSAAYVTLGGDEPIVRHVHRKVFLPTYGLFDEERFVERGFEVRAFDTAWGRAAILICEDAWHSITGMMAALDGAQVVFVSSAAPARGAQPRDDGIPGPATVARWERVIRDMAEEHGVFVVFTNLVGSEGGKFFGGSSTAVGPDGDIRVRGPLFEEALIPVTIDLNDLTRVRADAPLLADLRTAFPHLSGSLVRFANGPETSSSKTEFDPASSNHSQRIGGELPPLAIDSALVETWLVHFIRDEMARRGFLKAVVGVSGGVDSAVTAFLATRALGAENVIGVRMPYKTSSTDSLAHAKLVIDQLHIAERTVDISGAVDGYLANEPEADATRRGNVMARMRMITLFDLSTRYRALPLGTGNKSERLLGYFTWHADDSPPINPLGDLYKTQVWALAKHLGVPAVIVQKAPSADLVSGQTDEGDFGITYARADEILNGLLNGYTPDDLVARGYSPDEVAVVRKRLDGTHWKRRLPTVAMLSPTAIGESYLRPVDY